MTAISVNEAMLLGLDRHKAGKLAEAEAIYRQVLQAEPRHPDALNLLGLVMGDSGRPEVAVELIAAAIAANPSIAQFHANLGEMNRRLGRLRPAAESLRRALDMDSSLVDVYNTLGVVLKALGKSREALAAFAQAAERAPGFAAAQFNLGLGLSEVRKFEQAVAPLRRAVELKPDDVEAIVQLGTSLMYAGELDEAEQILRSVVAKTPESAEAYNNLGSCLYQKGRLEESIAMCRKALEIDSNIDHGHWNLGIALLRNGDMANGWPEYEWRLKNYWSVLKTPFTQPRWDGGELGGKTILIHAEQGFGDTLQFVRYLPRVAAKGGRIHLRCRRELARLLGNFSNVSRIEIDTEGLSEYDVYCPLLSLPLMFGTTLSDVPAEVPYIKPDGELARSWNERLGQRGNAIRIGLAWAGSINHKDDARRSIGLEKFAPLTALANVELHSLQKGPAAEQAKNPPAGMRIVDHANEIQDFADLAALVENLDLVISVDTAVAHLAGAMAKRVWVLLPIISDWRWMMDRSDSPWYPTMRLFRQKSADRWDDVMREVSVAASALVPGERPV
jgi:tetratricopeptide (TPR) repeat protein